MRIINFDFAIDLRHLRGVTNHYCQLRSCWIHSCWGNHHCFVLIWIQVIVQMSSEWLFVALFLAIINNTLDNFDVVFLSLIMVLWAICTHQIVSNNSVFVNHRWLWNWYGRECFICIMLWLIPVSSLLLQLWLCLLSFEFFYSLLTTYLSALALYVLKFGNKLLLQLTFRSLSIFFDQKPLLLVIKHIGFTISFILWESSKGTIFDHFILLWWLNYLERGFLCCFCSFGRVTDINILNILNTTIFTENLRFVGLSSSSHSISQALLAFDIGSVGNTIYSICCNLSIDDPAPDSKAHKTLFVKLLCTSPIELIISIILIDLKILLVWTILSIC